MEVSFTLTNLSEFTGRPTTYFTAFVTEALAQAGDLFELATGLEELPASGIDFRLCRRGILAMAEALHEGQPHRDLQFTPFRSETIGSYTYTLADAAIRQGIPTGVAWFDAAVIRMGPSRISETSISAFDRPGDVKEVCGRPYLIGPADSENWHGSPQLYQGYGGVG